ncbi:MAG: aminopeptidase [Saprospiraceae bacterium]|jgi:aminopeptidase
MATIIEKYAKLLVEYCLELQPGDKVQIATTHLSEPLLQSLQKEILEAGAHPHYSIAFNNQDRIYLENASDAQLEYVPNSYIETMETFDAYLFIQASFNTKNLQNIDPAKSRKATAARSGPRKTYMQRTATREMKRNLCLFPTPAAAAEANMSLEEYEKFVYGACMLFEDDPIAAWHNVHDKQQAAVDLLNGREKIRYLGPDIDISFSTKGRIWMNSDGQTNMPSGEVYTSPVEESVNGHIRFTYPGIYMGREIEDIQLKVVDGEVVSFEAKQGKDLLTELLALPGANRFGEAAIGTNYNIQRQTRNMLFDEKMGGTIHMALGQSYFQTGGKNESDIHWDLLANMRDGGEIYADDELIYKNGEFVF